MKWLTEKWITISNYILVFMIGVALNEACKWLPLWVSITLFVTVALVLFQLHYLYEEINKLKSKTKELRRILCTLDKN